MFSVVCGCIVAQLAVLSTFGNCVGVVGATGVTPGVLLHRQIDCGWSLGCGFQVKHHGIALVESVHACCLHC